MGGYSSTKILYCSCALTSNRAKQQMALYRQMDAFPDGCDIKKLPLFTEEGNKTVNIASMKQLA